MIVHVNRAGTGWEANANKAKYIDRYKTHALKFTDDDSMIMKAFSGCAFSMIVLITSIFIKHQQTPVVKSSNKLLTSIQLISQLSIIVLLPFLFIGEVN